MRRTPLTPFAVLVALAGCGTDRTATTADAAAPDDLAMAVPPDFTYVFHPFDAAGTGSQDCVGDARLIYLGGAIPAEGAALFSFDPQTFTFKKVGPLTGCPPSVWSKGGFYPTAMALDRSTAWINFWDGGKAVLRERLYKVDLANGTCSDTGADLAEPHGSFLLSGLGPIPDKKDPMKDLLYATVQYPEGVGMTTALATVDTTKLRVTTVAPIPAAAKLAYTGDGRLFGYMAGALVEFDPATAKVLSQKPLQLPISSWPGMAVVFWQKQIWFFVSADGPLSSTVHAYLIDAATGKATEKATLKDFYATGAVVQPCVAEVPPG